MTTHDGDDDDDGGSLWTWVKPNGSPAAPDEGWVGPGDHLHHDETLPLRDHPQLNQGLQHHWNPEGWCDDCIQKRLSITHTRKDLHVPPIVACNT